MTAVTIIEQRQTSSGSAVISITAPNHFTFTPQAGDVVLLNYTSRRSAGARTLTTVTGLGATWTLLYRSGRMEVWMGVGPTVTGSGNPIDCTQSGTGDAWISAIALRGLASTTNSVAAGGGPVNAGNGQFVLAAATSQAGAVGLGSVVPAAGWTTYVTNAAEKSAGRGPTGAVEAHTATWTTPTQQVITVIGTFAPITPDTPTGLTIDDADLTTLDLSWTASTGSPTGYDVRIDGGAPVDVGNVLTHQFTGLDPDTSYTLEVRAYNGAGDSAWASIVGDTDDLVAPAGLTIVSTTSVSASVEWDASTGAEGYRVRVDGGAATDVGDVLEHTFSGLTPDTAHTLEVQAYLGAHSSTWSSIVTETLVAGFYNVELVAGPYSWNITFGDEPDYGPTSGLWFGWEKPADDPFGFAHPDHMEAGFGIIVADPADLADLDEDDPVAIRVWLTEPGTPEECQWSFYGRVAEISAQPHRLGMIYNVDAVGYSVDPTEVLSGLEFWPGNGANSVQDRADLILAPVGATVIGLENFDGGVPLDRDPAPSPAWTLLLDLFKGAFGARAFGGTLGEIPYLALPVLHTYATDTGRGRGDGADYAVDYLDKYVHTATAPLPGLFGELDSELYGLVMATDAAYGSVDACGIETNSTKWQRTKADRPTRVRLEAWLYVTMGVPVEQVWTANRAAAALIIEATYAAAMAYNDYDAQLIADFLLPDPASQVWAAESYRFRLSDFPDGLPPMIPNFADHDDPGSEQRSAMWVRPIVINGIPSVHDPIGKGYVVGQLTAARLTISHGKVYVDFALNRTVPPPQPVATGYEPAEPGYLSGEHLQVAPYDAVTWLDLDPELTGYDLRLARETV